MQLSGKSGQLPMIKNRVLETKGLVSCDALGAGKIERKIYKFQAPGNNYQGILANYRGLLGSSVLLGRAGFAGF